MKLKKQVINFVLWCTSKISVHQQNNGSDCGVFAAAFATCLANDIQPQTAQFEIYSTNETTSFNLKVLKIRNDGIVPNMLTGNT